MIERFSEKLPAQYHYTRLQDATQERGESVEEFADRCKRFCEKIVRNVEDEATQRIINEEAERRLVAAYINGLGGLVGQQESFRMPHTLEEAAQVAVTVNNAERARAQGPKMVFSKKRDSSSQVEFVITAERRDITREIAHHLEGMEIPGIIVERPETEGGLLPARVEIPLIQETQVENKLGATTARNWVIAGTSVLS